MLPFGFLAEQEGSLERGGMKGQGSHQLGEFFLLWNLMGVVEVVRGRWDRTIRLTRRSFFYSNAVSFI